MTPVEYQQICEQIARDAIRYASEMAEEDSPDNVTSERDHWIDVYLDEHLPDIDADALLGITTNAGAFEKSAGHPAGGREIAARHALQADVWDAINRMETA